MDARPTELQRRGKQYPNLTVFYILFQPEEEFQPSDFSPLKKGLLWQQRDKLFSRWKERYFVLTKDYFHCFKKATSKITEMGGFIFKVKKFSLFPYCYCSYWLHCLDAHCLRWILTLYNY